MATRSNIAIKNDDGTVEMIYCHWDGYPSNNGVILIENYTTKEKVRELIEIGAVSSLGSEIGEPHDFEERFDKDDPRYNWTRFYGRDRGETGIEKGKYPDEFAARDQMEEYLYLFTPGAGWTVSAYGSTFRPVDKVLELEKRFSDGEFGEDADFDLNADELFEDAVPA
jgi:hypothetical protein